MNMTVEAEWDAKLAAIEREIRAREFARGVGALLLQMGYYSPEQLPWLSRWIGEPAPAPLDIKAESPIMDVEVDIPE